MAKGVLGNDPFQRGAALRGPPLQVEAPAPRPVTRTRGWKPRAGVQSKELAPKSAPVPVAEVPPAAKQELDQVDIGTVTQQRTPGSAEVGNAVVQLLKGTYRAARIALGAGEDSAIDNYGEDLQLVRELSPLAHFLYDRYWRVAVEGAENIPTGPCLLVANHAGALPFDGLMLRLAVARARADLREARWLLDDAMLQHPLFGVLLNRIGAVRSSPENAMGLLSERRPVIVFPEGMRAVSKSLKHRYELKPFGRGGFVKIAHRAGAPIVPVAVVGAEEAMPVLAHLPLERLGMPYLPLTIPPLPTKWSIRFGSPFDVRIGSAVSDDAAEIASWADRTRGSVQEMLQAMLSRRRSIFAG